MRTKGLPSIASLIGLAFLVAIPLKSTSGAAPSDFAAVESQSQEDWYSRGNRPQQVIVESLDVGDPECRAGCDVDAVVVAALPHEGSGRSSEICIANPFIQPFVRGLNQPIKGALVWTTLRPSDRPLSVLIEVPFSVPNGIMQGTLCASAEMIVGRRRFTAELLQYSFVRPAQLRALFGYESRHLVQIDVRSNPSGAMIYISESSVNFRTNYVFGVPGSAISSITLRLGRLAMPLSRCQAQSGSGTIAAVFNCEFRSPWLGGR